MDKSFGEIEDGRVQRVATGLNGLDKMLQGGIPRESIILLSGACGTGKSTFAMQFLYYGAKYCNEPGVYVTLEEDPKKLVENMALFGWDLQTLVDEKKLIVIKPEVYKFDSIKQIIGDAIEKIGARRLVVDSYSVMLTYFNDPYEIRNGLVQLDREIKKMGCTAMVISDIKDNSEIFSTTGVEEFIVDGVIVLYLIKNPDHPYESKRAISVRKMRATQHPLNLYPFDINSEGVSISGQGLSGEGHAVGEGTGRAGRDSGGGKTTKKRHITVAPKTTEKKDRQGSLVDLSALKSRGGHTWKWKHL
ncbi:MAG: KaiC domain-containing protein [Candidatus Micrarchaeota archaeon]|nr:KaiC domain-containing protein [Candidatus Micrarchaeota archaeon]